MVRILAQICANGHLISSTFGKISYTPCRCGAAAVVACSHCHQPIRAIHPSNRLTNPIPAYCVGCGHPFPWMKAAHEYSDLWRGQPRRLH